MNTSHESPFETTARVIGAILGSVATWLAFGASGNCLLIAGLLLLIVALPIAIAFACLVPRTAKVNRALLILLIAIPIAAYGLGHFIPPLPCDL